MKANINTRMTLVEIEDLLAAFIAPHASRNHRDRMYPSLTFYFLASSNVLEPNSVNEREVPTPPLLAVLIHVLVRKYLCPRDTPHHLPQVNGKTQRIYVSQWTKYLLWDHIDCLEDILQRASPTEKEDLFRYDAPLPIAVKAGDFRAAKLILEYGADPTTGSLAAACAGGSVECVKLLLGLKAMQPVSAFINKEDTYCRVPLTEASHYGHCDVVQLLLDLGAQVNEDRKGYQRYRRESALTIAALHGHIDCCKLLVSRGAAVNFMPTTLQCGAVDNKPVATESAPPLPSYFHEQEIKFRGKSLPLAAATRCLQLEAVCCLLQLGAHPNQTMKDGSTATDNLLMYQRTLTCKVVKILNTMYEFTAKNFGPQPHDCATAPLLPNDVGTWNSDEAVPKYRRFLLMQDSTADYLANRIERARRLHEKSLLSAKRASIIRQSPRQVNFDDVMTEIHLIFP